MRPRIALLALVAPATEPVAAALVNRGAANYEDAASPPQETGASPENYAGWSPMITTAPELPRYGLMARQNTFERGPDTCGYYSNGDPWRCYTRDATCVYASPYAGCCRSAEESCASLHTTCFDYTDVLKGSCDTTFSDMKTGCCYYRDKPSCVVNTIDLGDSQVRIWGCTEGNTGAVLVTTNPNLPPDTPTTTSPTPQNENTSPGSTTTPASSSEETGPENGTGGGENGESSTNVGAIAGGTVGGVGGLALIGAAIFLFMRHKKKEAAASTAGTGQMSQQPHQHQPGYGSPPANNAYGFNNSQPGYNYGAYSPGSYPQQQQPQQQPQHQQGSSGPYSPSAYSQGYGQPHQSWGYPSPTGMSTSPVQVSTASTSSPPVASKEPTSDATELPDSRPAGTTNNRAELG